MVKTKIDYAGVFLLTAAIICSIGLLLWMCYEWLNANSQLGISQKIIFTAISFFAIPFLMAEIFKLKSVEISNEKIVLRNLLTGYTK